MRALIVLTILAACDKSSSSQPTPKPAVAPIVTDAGTVDAVVAVADAAAPTVDAAPIACTTAALKAARKQAEAHVKAAQYDAAIALLQADGCYLDGDQDAALQQQIAWRISDLAFAYYKAGKFEQCYAEAASELAPYVGNVAHYIEDGPVIQALDYNAKICLEAVNKQRGAFTPSTTCTLAEGAWGLPAAMLDSGDREACIVKAEDTKDDDMNVCGAVTLVRQPKKGKISRTPITLSEGNLADGSVCCNVETVSFQRRAKTWAMLVVSNGRNCDGGTASSEEQVVYELDGTTLKAVHSMGASFH